MQPSSTPRPYVLAETTWRAVSNTTFEVAILPWGATEAHNYHLPYATDVIECDVIAAESARIAWDAGTRVIVLPNVPFGGKHGQIEIQLCRYKNTHTQSLCHTSIVDTL